jgi:hypothetical protein
MNAPDLPALRQGDTEAWDVAFRWLWPPVFAVAQLKLQPFLPGEVEDVAIESLEQLVEKVRKVKSVEELNTHCRLQIGATMAGGKNRVKRHPWQKALSLFWAAL